MAVIQVDDLHYAYPPLTQDGEAVYVLQGVDLTVERGEFLSIMGPTGVGKTTLCLALNGIVPQTTGGTIRGHVTVLGRDTRRTPVPEMAGLVGLVFQDAESQLFNMTVEDEVAFGPETLGLDRQEVAERVDWALAAVGMAEYRRRSPFQLSGGQKQRVAIASILAMRPEILILDEPSAGLDPLGKVEVFSVVHQLKRERRMTIVMVEHEAERIAEFSDRVAILYEGQIALSGAPQEVFARPKRLHEMGLYVPQVSELAAALNEKYGTRVCFTSLDQAYQALSPVLP